MSLHQQFSLSQLKLRSHQWRDRWLTSATSSFLPPLISPQPSSPPWLLSAGYSPPAVVPRHSLASLAICTPPQFIPRRFGSSSRSQRFPNPRAFLGLLSLKPTPYLSPLLSPCCPASSMPSFLKFQRVFNVVSQDDQVASKSSCHTPSPFKTQSRRSVEPSSTQNPTQIYSVFKLLAVIF
jgi:hypothetical protein